MLCSWKHKNPTKCLDILLKFRIFQDTSLIFGGCSLFMNLKGHHFLGQKELHFKKKPTKRTSWLIFIDFGWNKHIRILRTLSSRLLQYYTWYNNTDNFLHVLCLRAFALLHLCRGSLLPTRGVGLNRHVGSPRRPRTRVVRISNKASVPDVSVLSCFYQQGKDASLWKP